MSTESSLRKPPRNTAAIAGVIFASLGLLIFPLAPFGLILSIIGLCSEPRRLATVGTALGVLGIIMTPFVTLPLALPVLAQLRENAKLERAEEYVHLLHLESTAYNEQTGAWPTTIDDYDSREVLRPLDPWSTPYRFEGDGTQRPKISSAGPDGAFDTEDDITNEGMN